MENSKESEMESANNTNNSSVNVVSRIYEYPIVKDSFSKAGEYYNWIKGQNNAINYTLNWSEEQAKVILHKLEPIGNPIGEKLKPVDNYACSTLDKIEEKYPIVKEPTESVIQSTQEFYNSNKQMTVDKFNSAKDSAIYVAATPYRVSVNTLEYLSTTANNFVHHYLSGNNTENQENVAIYSKAIKELDLVKMYTLESVSNLNKLLNSVYENKVKANGEWIKNCYGEYCKELELKNEEVPSEEPTNQQISTLAMSYTDKMRLSLRAMSTVCYKHLSEANQQKMDTIFQKSEQLYNNMKHYKMEDVKQAVNRDNATYILDHVSGIVSEVKNSLVEKYKTVTGSVPEKSKNE